MDVWRTAPTVRYLLTLSTSCLVTVPAMPCSFGRSHGQTKTPSSPKGTKALNTLRGATPIGLRSEKPQSHSSVREAIGASDTLRRGNGGAAPAPTTPLSAFRGATPRSIHSLALAPDSHHLSGSLLPRVCGYSSGSSSLVASNVIPILEGDPYFVKPYRCEPQTDTSLFHRRTKFFQVTV